MRQALMKAYYSTSIFSRLSLNKKYLGIFKQKNRVPIVFGCSLLAIIFKNVAASNGIKHLKITKR